MKIAVLGAGTWAIALSCALCPRGHEIVVWSKFPEEATAIRESRTARNLPGLRIPSQVEFTSDPMAAVENARFILAAVPSVHMRETVRLFAPLIQGDPIWINAAKGIEGNTLMTLTEVMESELAGAGILHPHLTAISGPTHAEEVARNQPTLIVAAGHRDDATSVQNLFEGTCIRPYTNDDLRGVQICGALKNVEALAVGIATGLGYGDNTRAALITRGMEEIRRLGLEMGCQERTFFGLAGIGDLIVTATSRHSRNNRCGMLIGGGKTVEEAVKEIGMVVEGMNALPAAVALCRKYGMEMPIIESVRQVVEEHADPAEIVRDLMGRRLKKES